MKAKKANKNMKQTNLSSFITTLHQLTMVRHRDCTNFPGIKYERKMYMLGEKIENPSSGADGLHINSNLVISRRCQDENG